MAERKENNKFLDKENLKSYFGLIKKYVLKLLELDAKTYFFIIPGILLLIGLLPVPVLYFAILRIYVCISTLVLSYKFYINEKDNIFAIIFAGIAVIYNPIFFITFGNSGPIIFILTIAILVIAQEKIKE